MISLNGNLYGLLIAIDKYSDPVPALNGCVRDSEDVEAWLTTMVPANKLKIRPLRDNRATKKNIVDGFLEHLTQAGPDDTVFIHYSGHGSQENAHKAFRKLEPDGLNETLVCVDSRQVINGVLHRDLADKELGALIKKVSDTGAHVVIIFDCCHSGSGTRDTEAVTARQSPSDKHAPRGLSDYLFMDEQIFGDEFSKALQHAEEGFTQLPAGKHVLLAGSRSRQTAKELAINGKTGGIFTYALLEVLKRSQGRVTYRDLVARARAIVNNRVSDQDPQLDVVAGASASEFFLGADGTAQIADYYMMRYRSDKNDWVVEAGSLHGVPATTGEQGATFNVYYEDAGPDDEPFMTAHPTRVEGAYSFVDFSGEHGVFGTDGTFKAKLVAAPAERIRVRFEMEDSSNEDQKQAIEGLKMGLNYQPSDPNIPPAKSFIELVEGEGEVEYRVYVYHHRGQERIAIYRPTDNTPLLEQLTGFHPQNFLEVAKRLTAVARWTQTATLTNASTQINPNDLSIHIEAKHRDPVSGVWAQPVVLDSVDQVYDLPFYEFEPQGEEIGISPEIRIRVQNHSSSRTYYGALFYLMSNFGIINLFRNQIGESDEAKVEEIGPGQTVYALWGSFITPDVDAGLREIGLKQDTSLLKLVASTVDFNGATMEQEGFDYPQTMRDTQDVDSSVMQAMKGISHRGGLRIRRRQVNATDWTTQILTINSILTNAGDDERNLARAGVHISRPENTSFEVALSSSSTGSRGTDSLAIPGALLAQAKPFTFVQGRSTSPSLDVIELRNVENPEAISKENPITLTFNVPVEEGETLLCVNREDGIYIPSIAERAEDGTMKMHITSLSSEMAVTGERSLGRTFKLLIHKLFAGVTGKEFPYPRLGTVRVGEDGKAEYDFDPVSVKAALVEACDVCCVVHGFTSEAHESFFADTDGEADGLLPFLYHHYDLVLAFNYETYHTEVAINADGLKKRLEEAEFRVGDQQLDLVVHSLGGLVSRYFIEKLGGKAMVRRLIMCGTPNGGSPLTNIKNAFFLGGTLLLNAIPVVGWGISALGYIFGGLSAVNSLDRSSKDMKPNSDFLSSLNDGRNDPGLPYTILVGNTSTIKDEDESLVSKILDKIGIGDPDYSSLMGLIFGGPNDIAVSTVSIQAVPVDRSPVPKAIEVPCNHFGYFHPEGSLDTLKRVIEEQQLSN